MTHTKYLPRTGPRPRPMRKGGKPWKKFKGNCNYCGKQGHKAADCFEKKKKTSGINSKRENRNVLTVTGKDTSQEIVQGRKNEQKACLLER
jgi:hypothetical protein